MLEDRKRMKRAGEDRYAVVEPQGIKRKGTAKTMGMCSLVFDHRKAFSLPCRGSSYVNPVVSPACSRLPECSPPGSLERSLRLLQVVVSTPRISLCCMIAKLPGRHYKNSLLGRTHGYWNFSSKTPSK